MKKESGVSNVVGVILLLFLIIVTSAVLGLVLSSATYDAVDSMPNVIFTTSEDPYLLYNGGGDILYKNDLKFYAGGSDISDSISIDDVYDWTSGWHTGQAIDTRNTYPYHTASDLTIVTLDSRGNAYLIYTGPTADPIPGGTPVPDETPEPTTTSTATATATATATPEPVMPDASFTLTSVDPGLNVSMSGLPTLLTTTTDWIVVMSGGSDSHATVTFTANADDMETYAWSSSGGSVISVSNETLFKIKYTSHGDYTVTLTVTNSSGSSSSMKKISVRNPGLTAMTWVNSTQQNNRNIFAYHGLSSSNTKWTLETIHVTGKGQYKGYRMTIKLTSGTGIVGLDAGLPAVNTWYHVTGTYDERNSELTLFVKNSGTSQQNNVTQSGSVTDVGGVTTWGGNNFACNYSYEIPFALTADEINAVYDAENLDMHI